MDDPHLTAIDVLYNYLLSLSMNDSSSLVNRIRENFRGSPNCYFETESSVYPE